MVRIRIPVSVRVRVRTLYLFDQDEAARSAREGTMDKTTQATGQHYRGGFYEGFFARSAREGGKNCIHGAREAGPPRRNVRVRVRVKLRLRVRKM